MKVRVYFNLHNRKWSIKDCISNQVLGHADSVVIHDAKGIVSQAGRQRVLREQKKNVHAYLEGELVTVTGFAPYKGRIAYGNRQLREDWLNHSRSNTSWITYNPYKYECFVDQVRYQAYKGSKFAVMFPDRSCLAIDCKERLI